MTYPFIEDIHFNEKIENKKEFYIKPGSQLQSHQFFVRIKKVVNII